EREDRPRFSRHHPYRFGAERDWSIPVASGRTGERPVVIQDVAYIPADDHVTEPKALLEHREELLAADGFAAKDTINVDDSNFVDLDLRVIEKSSEVRDGRELHGSAAARIR